MSINGTLRQTKPPRGTWVGFDPANRKDGPLRLDLSDVQADQSAMDAEADALATEARHTGILITISLPVGVLITWLLDSVAGGPGLGAMIGL